MNLNYSFPCTLIQILNYYNQTKINKHVKSLFGVQLQDSLLRGSDLGVVRLVVPVSIVITRHCVAISIRMPIGAPTTSWFLIP